MNDPSSAAINAPTPSTGTFVYTWPGSVGVTTVGTYTWRVKGVGALIAAEEGSFTVDASLHVTP